MSSVSAVRRLGRLRLDRAACLGFLLLGAALRLREYLSHRPLWLDELSVTFNIIDRSYTGLFKPLSNNQAAPIGWLWFEKTAVNVFGQSDWTLRLVPFLFSLGTLALFYLLLRQWSVEGIGMVVAGALFALSPTLLRYSDEVKQYGSDVFFLLLVLVLTTRVQQHPTARNLALWTVLCGVSIWCSFPALLATAACAAALLALHLRPWANLRKFAVAGGVLALLAAIEYATNLRTTGSNPALEVYWRRGFAPKPFRAHQAANWLWGALVALMKYPANIRVPGLALFLIGVGVVAFVVRRGAGAIVVFAPVVVAIVGGLARKYPLTNRLALYLLPIVYFGLAALLDAWPSFHSRALRLAGLAVALTAVVVVGAPVAKGVAYFWHPATVTDSRGPFSFVAAHRKPGDVLYVEFPWAYGSYQFYGAEDHLKLAGAFNLGAGGPMCTQAANFTRLGAGTRVWFVMTHQPSGERKNRTPVYRDFFAGLGVPLQEFHSDGDAGAYLYRVRAAPIPVQSPVSWVTDGCLHLNSISAHGHPHTEPSPRRGPVK